MKESERDRRQTDLESLSVALGLTPPPNPAAARALAMTPISLDVDGRAVTVWVPPEGKRAFRRRYKDLASLEKRLAANAGNAANTSQLVGASIGGALATSGAIALVTASAPLALIAIITTGAGAMIAAGGLFAGHWLNKRKFEHETLMERYAEIAEDLT